MSWFFVIYLYKQYLIIYFCRHDLKTHYTEHINFPKCDKYHMGLPTLEQICQRHKSRIDKTIQTTCDICDGTFVSRKLLLSHIWKYHDPDLLFQCTACSFRFETASLFIKHITTTSYCKANANQTPSKLRWAPNEWLHHKCFVSTNLKCSYTPCGESFNNL